MNIKSCRIDGYIDIGDKSGRIKVNTTDKGFYVEFFNLSFDKDTIKYDCFDEDFIKEQIKILKFIGVVK